MIHLNDFSKKSFDWNLNYRQCKRVWNIWWLFCIFTCETDRIIDSKFHLSKWYLTIQLYWNHHFLKQKQCNSNNKCSQHVCYYLVYNILFLQGNWFFKWTPSTSVFKLICMADLMYYLHRKLLFISKCIDTTNTHQLLFSPRSHKVMLLWPRRVINSIVRKLCVTFAYLDTRVLEVNLISIEVQSESPFNESEKAFIVEIVRLFELIACTQKVQFSFIFNII